ncbi:uncharacterized protein N7483_009596 [Penicillium malachiteum]|uniref:uncharacterized protein n=1 Tax=Penicillium malachiteum TaxID=1324776 RepID=UPI002546977C|nr:uncharacterized protein N7483_009596 [Penicillium malachiteum]KAJ5721662.1 hypothetical protein N7483_009596 [Penicillium malachiteum]
MRVLYYTLICLFGTALAIPIHGQGNQARAPGSAKSTGLLGDLATDTHDVVAGVGETLLRRGDTDTQASGSDGSAEDPGLISDVANGANALVSDL